MGKDIPYYLQTYDDDILKELKVKNVDVLHTTFEFEVVFYDPTDDIHQADETGLVKKIGTAIGTFTYDAALPSEKAGCEDDLYPEIVTINFGGIAVSDEMWLNVQDELECAILNKRLSER